MLVIAVEFNIKPAHTDQFREAILKHAHNSLTKEEGCRQFDVCYAKDDPTSCFLYEKYDDEAAFEVHKSTDYFAQVGTDIEPWLESKELKMWYCEG